MCIRLEEGGTTRPLASLGLSWSLQRRGFGGGTSGWGKFDQPSHGKGRVWLDRCPIGGRLFCQPTPQGAGVSRRPAGECYAGQLFSSGHWCP